LTIAPAQILEANRSYKGGWPFSLFLPPEEFPMTTFAKSNGFPGVLAGVKLLGEVITWSCNGVTIRHLDLITALRDADLDESVARELAPRHAFSRACRKLSEARIIRQVAEDETTIHFQFTSEHKEGDRYSYDFETLLTLTKATGKVTCDIAGLATLAQEHLDHCIQARTGSDVTRIVQRLFERKADLFPIREKGGAYFVPQEHVGFVDQVQAFLGKINGRMQRYPVPAGTPEGDRSVKESVAAALSALIAEHEAAIGSFGEDTRSVTLERAAERIRLTRHKIEAYACYLGEERDRLNRDVAAASARLRARVEELATIRSGEAASLTIPA
jgi:hypothetical protein